MKRIDKFNLFLSIPVALIALVFMAMLVMTGITLSNAQAEEVGGIRIPATVPETTLKTSDAELPALEYTEDGWCYSLEVNPGEEDHLSVFIPTTYLVSNLGGAFIDFSVFGPDSGELPDPEEKPWLYDWIDIEWMAAGEEYVELMFYYLIPSDLNSGCYEFRAVTEGLKQPEGVVTLVFYVN